MCRANSNRRGGGRPARAVGFRLDSLAPTAAYARVAAEHDPETFANPEDSAAETDGDDDSLDQAETEAAPEDSLEEVVSPEAIVEGAAMRIRPKMMTVLAIMAGLAPILWSRGTGADVMKRIAAPISRSCLSGHLRCAWR